jgi:hypothetical protein
MNRYYVLILLVMQKTIQIIREADGQEVAALLLTLIQKHVDDYNHLWLDLLRQYGQEDKFWSWALKERVFLRQDNYEGYAIEWQERTQGLMMIETQRHRSQIVPGQRLVYVSAIATAPWNRRIIRRPRDLQGVGSILMQFARKRSLDLGFEGRVGVHSLPEAERFYDRLNMMDLGADPDQEDLVYFEFGRLEYELDF